MLQSARIVRLALSISVLAVFLTAAFAEDHYTKSKEPVFPAVQPGHALLYLARPHFLNNTGTDKVFVDSTPVGWLPWRSYIAVQVDPGSRVVWGPMNSSPQRFEFQAGITYFLQLRVVEQHGTLGWVPGDPAYVQAFVADQKLTYVEANKDSLDALREEGEKKFGKQEQRAPEVHAAALPAAFEKVCYRRAQGASVWKACDASGTLTVSSNAIEFKSDKENFTIPVQDVKSVALERLTGRANNIALANNGSELPWGIVTFTRAGAEETVAFRQGLNQGVTEAVFLTLGSAVQPVLSPKGTVAGSQLVADITNMIAILEGAEHPGCALQVLKQVGAAFSPGRERWDVKSCEAVSSYDVEMVPSPKGGTDFRVAKSVAAQQKSAEIAAPPQASAPPSAVAASSGELVLYEGQKSQFTLSLPRGWVAYDQSALPGVGADPRFNLIVFYLSPNPGAQGSMAARLDEMSAELMGKIDTGESPGFFLQKFPAKKGMSCDGFSEGAEKEVLKVVGGDAAFRKGATILEGLHSEPVPFAGCKGMRIRGAGQPAGESIPQTSDVYAASDGKALYLFSLRNHADYYKKNLEAFQKSMATARLTGAK